MSFNGRISREAGGRKEKSHQGGPHGIVTATKPRARAKHAACDAIKATIFPEGRKTVASSRIWLTQVGRPYCLLPIRLDANQLGVEPREREGTAAPGRPGCGLELLRRPSGEDRRRRCVNHACRRRLQIIQWPRWDSNPYPRCQGGILSPLCCGHNPQSEQGDTSRPLETVAHPLAMNRKTWPNRSGFDPLDLTAAGAALAELPEADRGQPSTPWPWPCKPCRWASGPGLQGACWKGASHDPSHH